MALVQLARLILASAHVLAGSAWFGAMFYSLMVLHPRARAFFRGPREFEEFVAYIAAGARWKVLGGAAFIAATGVGLLVLRGPEQVSGGRNACLAGKVLLFVIAVGVFCFTSWRLWPARVMASTEEIPKFQRAFGWVAMTLLILVGASMVLGVIGKTL
jgi:hypothetical protein